MKKRIFSSVFCLEVFCLYLHRADFVDGLEEFLCGCGGLQRIDDLIELGDIAGADEGGGDGRVLEGPLDGEVVELGVVLHGELAEGLDLIEVVVDLIGLEETFGACGAGIGGDAVEVFGGEHALGERAEGDAADAFIVEPIKNAGGFHPAVEDRIGWLIDQAADAHFLEDFDRFF